MKIKTTKKQIMSLLRKVQKFQIANNGINRITITFAKTNGVWFNAWGFGDNDKLINLSVYQFYDYNENLKTVEDFINTFSKNN